MTNSQPKDFIDQEEIVNISPEQKQWVLSEIARFQAQPRLDIRNLLILIVYEYLEKKSFQVPRRVLRSIHDGSSLT